MQFEPKGGFPSIIKIEKINKKILEVRSYPNIVNIEDIYNNKKNGNIISETDFLSLGNKPNDYEDIDYILD